MPSTTGSDTAGTDTGASDGTASPEERPLFNLTLSGLILLSSGASLYEMSDVSPALLVAGFVVTGLAYGPAASTAPGRRFVARFRAVHGAVRLAIVFGVVALVFGLAFAFDVPPAGVQSAVFGGAVALAAYVVYRILADRFGDG